MEDNHPESPTNYSTWTQSKQLVMTTSQPFNKADEAVSRGKLLKDLLIRRLLIVACVLVTLLLLAFSVLFAEVRQFILYPLVLCIAYKSVNALIKFFKRSTRDT